eukprot:227261-Pleurochrysis_carterae.AAC.1
MLGVLDATLALMQSNCCSQLVEPGWALIVCFIALACMKLDSSLAIFELPCTAESAYINGESIALPNCHRCLPRVPCSNRGIRPGFTAREAWMNCVFRLHYIQRLHVGLSVPRKPIFAACT